MKVVRIENALSSCEKRENMFIFINVDFRILNENDKLRSLILHHPKTTSCSRIVKC